jgi:LuxR family maltose regulon positive regulatory protein
MEHNTLFQTADIHYYSDRLKNKLNKLLTSRSAIVEAPSGYGKTTAVRDYLESALPRDTPVFWFAAADEAPMSSFRRFCRVIGELDAGAGERLLKAGLKASAVGEACDALRSIRCRSEAYLVLDNFQFMQPSLPTYLFTALLEHGGAGLHVIVITQMLSRNLTAAAAGLGVAHITAYDLRFDAEDIRQYFALSGARISADGANEIARRTEGWIAAVRLLLSAYGESGSLPDTSGIFALMEHLVWDALTDEQQDFLLRLSPFGAVTAYQACALCGWDALPDFTRSALANPFIRYESSGRHYELHAILSGFLAQKRRERGAAFDRECLLAAGDCCRDEGDVLRAMFFYAQAGNYERMLRLDLSALYFEAIGGEPFYELALKIARECPRELKQKYPLSMLRIAYELLAAGMNEDFFALLDELYPILEENGGGDPLLLGEWLLLASFRYFPRLDEMSSLLKKASCLFGGACSRVILPDSPWFYGIFSPFSVFHTVPGEAEREADALEDYVALYSKLTNGHGAGADALFRAELARYRGNQREAEIQAYRALYIAQSRKQRAVQLAVTFHLAEIALENADTAGWQNAVSALDDSLAALPNIFVLPSAMDAAKGMLFLELGRNEETAAWLKSGAFQERRLPAWKAA